MKILFTENTVSDYYGMCSSKCLWVISKFHPLTKEIEVKQICKDPSFTFIRHFHATTFRRLLREGIIKVVKE